MIAHSGPAAHGLLVGVGVAAIAWRAVRWWRTPASGPTRLAAWAAGVLALLAATAPPVERAAGDTFTAHMVQHLVIVVLAAPLLVVGAGGAGIRPPARLGRTTRAALRAAVAPVAAAVFVVTLAATHFTGVYDAALRDRTVHDLEHLAYLGAAVALWGAIGAGGRRIAPGRVVAVFVVIAATGLVAAVLLSAEAPLVDTYARRLGATAALADQRDAAALMWVSGMAVTLPLLVLAAWRWAAGEHRATVARERLLEGDPRPTPDAEEVLRTRAGWGEPHPGNAGGPA